MPSRCAATSCFRRMRRPRWRPGDEAEVGVGVTELDSQRRRASRCPSSIALKTGPQLRVIGPARARPMSLASMHEGAATFRVRATSVLLVPAISASPPATARKIGASGRRHLGSSCRGLPLADRIARVMRRRDRRYRMRLRQMVRCLCWARDGSISTAPMVMTVGLSSWLVNYDNYSAASRSSAPRCRVSPRLEMVGNPDPARGRMTPVAWRDNRCDRGSDRCASARGRTMPAAAGIWAATPQSEPFVSAAYAVHFPAGSARPRHRDTEGRARQRQRLPAATGRQRCALTTLGEQRQRAYAVYLLTPGRRHDQLTSSLQKRLDSAWPGNPWKSDPDSPPGSLPPYACSSRTSQRMR